jgi:hypothetical protein
LSKELTPDFSYSFKGPVWKTFPDPERRLLALEIRDSKTHQVTFSVVSFETDRVILKDLIPDEPWWISLVAFMDHVLFTRIFPDEQDPGKSNLQAYDIKQNKVLWTIPGLIPGHIGTDKITGFIQLQEERKTCTVDVQTGKILFTGPMDGPDQNISGPVSSGHNLHYPVQYHQADDGFKTLEKYISRLGKEPCLAIDYLEFSNYIIINYYNRSDNELVNFLLILNSEGKVLYHEKTGTGKGIAMDSFFIMEDVLVFTGNKQNISGIILR